MVQRNIVVGKRKPQGKLFEIVHGVVRKATWLLPEAKCKSNETKELSAMQRRP